MIDPILSNAIERELSALGGRLEWLSDHGAGVSLSGCPLRDEDLHSLSATIANIVWLDLSRCPITDFGIEALASVPVLEELDLSGTRVTAKIIGTLAKMPRLVRVRVWKTTIRPEDILVQASEKSELEFSFTPLADEQKEVRVRSRLIT